LFKNYLVGGIFAIISALITLPLSIMSFVAIFDDGNSLSMWTTVLTAFHSIIVMFLMLYFKAFLEEKFQLSGLTWLFSLIILLTFAINGVSMAFDFESLSSLLVLVLVAVVLTIPLGILYFVLSQKIMKCDTDSVAHSKSTGYAVAATGLLMATLIFAEFSVLASMVMDILMALMFISNRKMVETVIDVECEAQ